MTGRSVRLLLRRALDRKRAPGPIEAFKRHGEDFVVADDLPPLVARMSALVGGDLVALADIERELVARDCEMDNAFGEDTQVMLIRNARIRAATGCRAWPSLTGFLIPRTSR